jgi:hypothetical protein
MSEDAPVTTATRVARSSSIERQFYSRRILIQPAGGSGFSVDYFRRVYENEELRRNEHCHVRYGAVDEVIAVWGH